MEKDSNESTARALLKILASSCAMRSRVPLMPLLNEISRMRCVWLLQTSTVAVAHRLSSVAHCDTIIVLEKGRIVQQGPHAELLKNLTARMLVCGLRSWRHVKDR